MDAEADVFFFEDVGAVNGGDGVGVEKRGGVAHAAGFEEGQLFEVGLLEVGDVDAGVEFEAGDEVLRLQASAGGVGEFFAESGEVLPRDAEAGGHVVAAERSEQIGAVAEGLDEGEAVDAASAAVAGAGLVESDDDGGAVVFAAEAGGDDADDAGVPAFTADDHGAVAGRVEMFFEIGEGGFENVLFEVLALAVAGVEFLREAAGFGGIFGEEEVQGGFGGVEASGGVEARTEAEADFGGGDGRDDGGDVHEGAEALPFGVAETGQAMADYDTVLTAQRGEVADGAHGGEVEEFAQVGVSAAGDFLDAVAKFEDEGGGAEVGVAAEGLGVDQGGARCGAVFRFVVIDDDEVDAAGREPGGFLVRTGPAVERDNKGGLPGGEDAVESVAAQAVAFGLAEREEPTGLESERGKEAVEDGEGGDAIDVIVAVEDDIFAAFDGEGDPAGGGFKSGRSQRIRQRGEARVEEVVGLAGVGEGARGKQGGEQGGDTEFAGQFACDGGIGGIPRFPARRQHKWILRSAGGGGNAKGFARRRRAVYASRCMGKAKQPAKRKAAKRGGPRGPEFSGKARFLVTGGAGFIGSVLVGALNCWHGTDRIVVVDELGTDEKWRNLSPLRFEEFVEADEFYDGLAEKAGAFGNFTHVFHLGACSSTTERDADYLLRNNFGCTRQLAEWALARGSRFVYASSAATYGDGAAGMDDRSEDLAAWRPLNAYGYSKQLFDLHAQREGYLPGVVGLKYFNIFGPNEEHKGEMRSVVSKAWRQIEETGQVKLFKSYHADYPDGGQRRDFLYVKDAVAMTLHLAAAKKAGGLFNIGSGVAHTWLELVHPIFEAMGREPRIDFIEMPEALRAQYQYFTQADIVKLRSTGYSGGVTPLPEAVKDYVSRYLLPRKHFGDGAGD